MEMDAAFMDRVQVMRTEARFPFPVTSAYRCPEYNAKVSSTGRTGAHTHGRALDIAVPSHRLYDFWRLAYLHGFTGHGHGAHKGFCHIDNLTPADGFAARPNAWTY